MAYKSQINLGGLGEVPKTQDNNIFADMTDVYNAIHILAQWVNALVERAQDDGDKGPDKKPWETMPFDKWYWAPAARAITKGSVVVNIDANRIGSRDAGPFTSIKGVVNGAASSYNRYPFSGAGSGLQLRSGITGVALNDAAVGELVQIGIGPAIVNIAGITAGRLVYSRVWGKLEVILGGEGGGGQPIQNPSPGYTRLINDGAIYLIPENSRSRPGLSSSSGIKQTGDYAPVGIGVADDSVMFFPYMISPDYLSYTVGPLGEYFGITDYTRIE